MTADQIIDGLLAREGGWRDAVQRPDGSWDPATNMGVTLPTLIAWRKRQLRLQDTVVVTTAAGPVEMPVTLSASLDDLRQLTNDEARQIYQYLYIDQPGFTEANIPFEPLRVQLIDFGVNSGPARAVRWLQRVIGLQPTGTMNLQTIRYLTEKEQWVGMTERSIYALVNDALCAARLYMIDQATDQGAIRKQDEEGLESRALGFFLARPEAKAPVVPSDRRDA